MKVIPVKSIVKVGGENNIFFDIDENLVRYRMHCPNCGVVTGCKCFKTLFEAEAASGADLDYTCSYKCSIICCLDYVELDEIIEIMNQFGLKWRIKAFIYKYHEYLKYFGFKDIMSISEEDAKKIYVDLDLDFEEPQGESC